MKRTIYAVAAVVLLVLSVSIYRGYRGHAASVVLAERMKDVEVLTRFYATNPHAIENPVDLITRARSAGIHLINPIPKNPSAPCYRLANQKTNFIAPQVLVEETTNVADDSFIVRSMSDGHVEAGRRNQQ